jgi:hypothetical protein
MAILNNSNAISSGGYDINNSLRFRSSASAYLNRTPGTASNRKTWTWSGWVKRGTLGTDQTLFSTGPVGVGQTWNQYYIDTNNKLTVINFISGSVSFGRQTNAVYRDPSAWYHVVIRFDTTQATDTNRLKFYVNGVEQDTVTAAGGYSAYPTLNYDGPINNTVAHGIGGVTTSTAYLDGYLTEVNFIDGQALTPSSFGETDTDTGSWKPKAYTGTYGTNGFYLKFSDIATTSGSNAGLGKDFSGNTNYWTTNNISVTAGVTYDAMIDSPTLTSATVANYAVLNPLDNSTPTANANLRVNAPGGNATQVLKRATMNLPLGMWYWEVTLTSVGGAPQNNPIRCGVATALSTNNAPAYGAAADLWTYFVANVANDVYNYAFDQATGKFWAGLNGVWVGSGNPATGVNPFQTITADVFPFVWVGFSTGAQADINFGQRPFSYTPPSGFVALNTFNLPDSTIKKGNTVMDATLYTGNGAARSITNAGSFSPDLVWMKRRNSVSNNYLQDTVRGELNSLFSDQTLAEATQANTLTSFNSNGFSLGTDAGINNNGDTYVAWQWDAGSSTVTNTSGSISSQVRANTTAGFSIVTYSGNSSSGATVGHGLGVKPAMTILKSRVGTESWNVWHKTFAAETYFMGFNTNALQTTFTNRCQAFSSSLITLGNNSEVNSTGYNYVAYCWAEISGYSKFGSYVGNGGSPGPFVYLGFRPKFIMVKSTATNRNWCMFDTSRSSFNTASARLFANTSGAESVNEQVLFLSNGFQMTTNTFDGNANGETYIFMAFAEVPTKFANAR